MKLTKMRNSDTMGQRRNRVGYDGSMGHKRGMSKDWCMGNPWCIGSRMGNSLRVGSSSLIADLSNKSIIVIGTVVHSLDTAIRKVDRVRTLNNTISIIRFSLVEGSIRVVISNSIVEAVGRDLSKIRGSIARSMGNSNRVSNSQSWGISRVSNGMSNRVSNGMSNRVSNGMSKRVSNGMSYRVTKSSRVGNHTTSSM